MQFLFLIINTNIINVDTVKANQIETPMTGAVLVGVPTQLVTTVDYYHQDI